VYENDHVTNVVGVELNATWQNILGETGFGLESRNEYIQGDWVRGGNESDSNLDGFSRENAGMYAEHRFKVGRSFDITPGVYLNWATDFGWNAFPGIDMGYSPAQRVRIYANAGSSYRIPTFYDQYYESPTEYGNPNLKPEEAIGYEAGVRYMGDGFSFEMNHFNRSASNLIDWVLDPADSAYYARNFQNVDANGIEISADLNLQEIVSRNFFIARIFASYNQIDQNLTDQSEVVSRYVLEHINRQVIAGVDFRIFNFLSNHTRMRYIERVSQEPYVLVDTKFIFEYNPQWLIYLEATNLFDEQYTEVMTPMPGIWVRGGLRFSIGG
jgi:iron complex outermembrane receptor protein